MHLNPLTAHQLSCLSAIVLWTASLWVVCDNSGIASMKDALTAGAIWFVLTITAETFLINKLMSGLSWNAILQTYNVSKGQLWGLVLISSGILPVVVYKVKAIFN